MTFKVSSILQNPFNHQCYNTIESEQITSVHWTVILLVTIGKSRPPGQHTRQTWWALENRMVGRKRAYILAQLLMVGEVGKCCVQARWHHTEVGGQRNNYVSGIRRRDWKWNNSDKGKMEVTIQVNQFDAISMLSLATWTLEIICQYQTSWLWTTCINSTKCTSYHVQDCT